MVRNLSKTRRDLFNPFSMFKPSYTHPHWIIGGDFNMILTLEEKTGGTKTAGAGQW
jgi:hypothetical protein